MGALDGDLKQTLRRDSAYLLAPSALLCLHSYTAQTHMPRHSAATHGRLVLPHQLPIKTVPAAMPSGHSDGGSPSTEAPFSRGDSSWCQVDSGDYVPIALVEGVI